ncbi:hypothetical protein BTR14_11830 [Rhizobium rhizosphaerae]|uniref:Uncharacterized protein n=1 Tax=Xaviernesmea rhizosphaerae TaxID=1672749 RepID=A0ABX3PCD9_9HYPH|nr:hypothetical protein [Xaviernesmea rhizosphaerae]OQP86083.1 hypothetical protein BTR14_11830 [Xaviernesmea rhizosphaerae]
MTSAPSAARSLETPAEAMAAIGAAWPLIVADCRKVLGGELHYQAMIYHCLRLAGVPIAQLGMNVKQWIANPVSPLFQKADLRKHEAFRGGFEPIPDLVLFSRQVGADWRRRSHDNTLLTMRAAIEVKASERKGLRLGSGEIIADIEKLAAHRDEVSARGGAMIPVMMVIDTAPIDSERMRHTAIEGCRERARELGVLWFYLSPDVEQSPTIENAAASSIIVPAARHGRGG